MKVIRVYCGVKYEDKDEAKKLGFKFDKVEKKWYQQYEIDDENASFGNFKPYKVEICDILKNMLKQPDELSDP